eukprot:NODE_2538_length_1174_cov_404.968889_g2319_i0.p1 GENE.NODE_2538_length_1174_cov_404.968889_g2319_i0~~NODE_2538_length_1174_cov_404.968889_g2319_i0.p1  ORF type:complete len:176 (-),score=34.50 NODE_2538_length_1174_cov_404.968889_g2319_i0:170-697(-)
MSDKGAKEKAEKVVVDKTTISVRKQRWKLDPGLRGKFPVRATFGESVNLFHKGERCLLPLDNDGMSVVEPGEAYDLRHMEFDFSKESRKEKKEKRKDEVKPQSEYQKFIATHSGTMAEKAALWKSQKAEPQVQPKEQPKETKVKERKRKSAEPEAKRAKPAPAALAKPVFETDSE